MAQLPFGSEVPLTKAVFQINDGIRISQLLLLSTQMMGHGGITNTCNKFWFAKVVNNNKRKFNLLHHKSVSVCSRRQLWDS